MRVLLLKELRKMATRCPPGKIIIQIQIQDTNMYTNTNTRCLTPVYKTTILGTEKHIAEIFFFGHFLLRLSGPHYSRVISKASFCWAHSDLHYEILTKKSPIILRYSHIACFFSLIALNFI